MYRFNHIWQIHDYIQQNKREKELRDIKDSINRSNNYPRPVITRTAAIQKAGYLLRSGAFEPYEVALHSKLPLYEVQSLKGRLEKEAKETKYFLTTGQMPREGGYHAIFPR